MQLSVVVPVHNEALNVEQLIKEISAALGERFLYEIIFIDDGSNDDTLIRLQNLMPHYPLLRVLSHRRCCGQSRAIHTGINAARYPWIITLDGDGQNDPADIPQLIDTYQRHDDKDCLWMLVGYRHRRHDTVWRRFSSFFANYIRQMALHDHTPDTGCGLKLFLRDKFLTLPYFDHMHRFLPALVLMSGGQVASTKVGHRRRHHGRSKYGTLDRLSAGIVDLLGVIWLKKRHSLPVVEEIRYE